MLVFTLASLNVFAADLVDTGTAGATGASGVIAKKGGDGGAANANLVTTDFLNSAMATAGSGGNGGTSFSLLPGGKGGNGGKATTNLQAGGQDFPPDSEVTAGSTANAIGGDGGNGGGGLIKGDGGAGGAAQATGSESGNSDVFGTTPLFSLLVNAAGGRGGSGLNGGAGGGSDASSSFTAVNGGATVRSTSAGGAGGSAILKGGNGGNASADATYNTGGQPNNNVVDAVATGGNGGSSVIGVNGNGGAATAVATGSHASRGEGIVVSATAVGGDSGATVNPFLLRGNGGDAYAKATAAAVNLPVGSSAQSTAQGGDGVLRGGNALATAIQSASLGGDSKATASGGAGKHAGAAIATATASNDDWFGTSTATATANYTGKFVRQVAVNAEISEPFSDNQIVPGVLYTQARVGDTSGILTDAPAPTTNPGLVARAAAPTAAEANIALAGNPTVTTALAGGSVWGMGDFATVNTYQGEAGPIQVFDSLTATSSYTFDIGDIANPQHLLLGLLDSGLPGDSIGNFHFSLAGEGTTLFEHDFTGADFLSFFDDRVFDLGTWANLVGADGLFNLDVSFAGYVPEIEFVFGEGAAPAAVPEPSALALLLAGALGLLLSRNRQAFAGLRSAGFGALPRRPGRSRSASRYSTHRKVIMLTAGLLLVIAAVISMSAYAVDVSDTGLAGADGASGVLGKPGGAGENGRAAQSSSDIANNITAIGGKGGNGGASLPLLPGGKGGNGGEASAALLSAGQNYPPDTEVQSSGNITAKGGDGGNGGSGLIRGNGGKGGGANAKATDAGAASDGSLVTFSQQVSATGGKGGTGTNGGAGGNGTAFGRIGQGETQVDDTATVTATGGAGGAAVLRGGAGGSASATAALTIGDDPHYGNANAVATGGRGGNSALGLNGNGGNASATADGSLSAGDIGLNLSATAIGGASGSGGLFPSTGNGGAAVANSKGGSTGEEVTFATSHSVAQGGAGVVSGGDAIATARAHGQLSGEAVAEASGGAGRHAGAAVATARASNTFGFDLSSATATATYAGPFVRQVAATGLTTRGGITGDVFAQASVGDTTALQPQIPGEPPRPTLKAIASAPTTAQANAALADNVTIAGAFATGSVWGLGELGTTNRRSDRNEGSASFTFDIGALANPQHLWLGLLDAEPGYRNADFDFTVRAEGATLFQQHFVGTDYLDIFDDRAFDLGSWANLVGSDGLLDFDVSLSGYVPDIEFAFGDAAASLAKAATAVPESSVLGLLLVGMLAMLISRRRRSKRPVQSHGKHSSFAFCWPVSASKCSL